MEKRRIRKEDGRYLIFYGFERPIPEVNEERGVPEDDREEPPSAAAEKGGDA